MEKPKGKPKAKREPLVLTIPFEFRSILPFEECRDRLFRIEDKSRIFQQYYVEVYPTAQDDEYEMCEFRIVAEGHGVEATGYLRAGLEELTTQVEGYVGVKRVSYLGSMSVIAIGFLLMIVLFFQSSLFNSIWGCVALIVPLAGFLAWYKDFEQRGKVMRFIHELLESK